MNPLANHWVWILALAIVMSCLSLGGFLRDLIAQPNVSDGVGLVVSLVAIFIGGYRLKQNLWLTEDSDDKE